MWRRILVVSCLVFCGCSSTDEIDNSLVWVPVAPEQSIKSNGTLSVVPCNFGEVRSSLEVGMVRSGLTPAEARIWQRDAREDVRFPIINEAATLTCVMVPELQYRSSIRIVGGSLDVWLYAPQNHPLLQPGEFSMQLAHFEDNLGRALNRTGVTSARLIVAAVCSDNPGGDSFSFAGRANGSILVLRAALSVRCQEPSRDELQDALGESLDTALHEGVHVVNYPTVMAAANRPEMRVADELVASLVGRELTGRPLRLPHQTRPLDSRIGCDVPVTMSSGLVIVNGDLRIANPDPEVEKRLTEGFGKAMIRSALALGFMKDGTGSEFTPHEVSAFLDEWGIDVARVADAIAPAVNCQL